MTTIVFVVTDLEAGGAENMLLRLLEHLDAQFSAHVIALRSGGDIGEKIRAMGVPVQSLGMRRANPFAVFGLARRLRRIRPDVVHTWMYHANLVGGLAARAAGIRAVAWSIHHSSSKSLKLSTRLVSFACAALSRTIPSEIVICSDAARRAHPGYAPMMVLPNGFDVSLFAPNDEHRLTVRRELDIPATAPLVGFFARHHPQKNHAGFFEAAAIVHNRLPGAHFILAGKNVNPSNAELERSMRAAGIDTVAHLLGERADIPRLMASLDVFVLPSFEEAFPLVLGEAMASGVPCVTTEVGDSAFIVGDTGKVVRPGDTSALAAAIFSILTLSPAERANLGARARSRITEQFEIGAVTRRFESLYAQLVMLER